MIEVKNLKKSFKGVEILKGISAIFEKGKTNIVIGQSGSGKTIFLKCILQLLKQSSGEIYYDGINISYINKNKLNNLKCKIGVVFQTNALFDSMNVEQNISFPLKMLTNKSNYDIKKKVNNILKKIKLYNINSKYPSELSGGMKKRVAIARAIINKPKFLLFDEPNSGLDPKTSIVIDKLIYELTKEYMTTTIITTHDMNSVMEIGEKILFLKNGYKVWEGNSNQILESKNKNVLDFVYSFSIYKKYRNLLIK